MAVGAAVAQGSSAGTRGADLLAAVRDADPAAVQALLEVGVSADTRDPGYLDATALMLAVERDQGEIGRLLLAAGADPDARDINGDTALNWAAYYGFLDRVLMLLESGADPALAGHGDALQIARRRGFEDLLQPLAERLGRIRSVPQDEQDVVDAVRAGDVAYLRALLARKPRTADAHDRFGRSALQLAAGAGRTELVVSLLESGADPDSVDPIGFTPLMDAARAAHAATVTQLLAVGADASHRAAASGLLMTPLHMAAVGGDPETCRLLLDAGADIDAQGGAGNPPAMWALAEGHVELVEVLLGLGADPDIANEDGDSIRSLAQTWNITPVLEILVEED